MEATPRLQLVRHDSTANAPELSINPAELRYTSLELSTGRTSCLKVRQVADEERPERDYSSSLPEVTVSQSKKADSEKGIVAARFWGLSKKHLSMILISCFVIIATVSIGIGVGLKSKKQPDGVSASPFTSSSILNDTSIAAVILGNGDRHLFYQDNGAQVRQVVYKTSLDQWSKPLVVGTKAKAYSPFAAVNVSDTQASGDVKEVPHLFYIDSLNELASAEFALNSWKIGSEWPSNDSNWARGVSGYLAISGSRYLSAVSLPSRIGQRRLGNSNELIVYYENQMGNVTALRGTQLPSTNSSAAQSKWRWSDCSHEMYDLAPGVKFGIPFTSALSVNGWRLTFRDDTMQAEISGEPASGVFMQNYYEIPDPPPSNIMNNEEERSKRSTTAPRDDFSISYKGSQNITSTTDQTIKHADIADLDGYLVWVRAGTRFPHSKITSSPELMTFNTHTKVTASKTYPDFPYRRLAKATAINGSYVTFLYHQLDGNTFAEEQYDASIDQWLPATNISTAIDNHGT